HGSKDNAAILLIIDTDPGDHIGTALDAWKALIDRFGVRQVVDEHEHLGCIAAHIEPDRWALPVDLHRAVASGFHEQVAIPVAQSHNHGAAAFHASDIGVRAALFGEHPLHGARKPFGRAAEEIGGSVD